MRGQWSQRAEDRAPQILACATSFVYKTLIAFVADGWFSLLDGRRENGEFKADADFRRVVRSLVDQSPRDYGFVRPTWTRELLVLVAAWKNKRPFG